MAQQKKHRRRVSFSDAKEDRPEADEFLNSRDRMKSESFRQGSRIMKEYNSKESEFAASIAAAAYAIYSLEGTRAEFERRMVESFREDPSQTKSRRHSQDGSANSHFDLPDLGSLMRPTSELHQRRDVGDNQGSIVKNSTRGIEISGVEQRRSRRVEMTKAEAWEQARLAKINKWYEKMKVKIIEWENEKKKKAEIDMERRKAELKRLKRLNYHHHRNKIDKIEDVAAGARNQLEEKKRREEAYAKQQANKIRSTGRVPVQCLCFEC